MQQQAGQQVQAAAGGQPDYSKQWAEYYRNIGKIEEAEAIENQMKASKVRSIRFSMAIPILFTVAFLKIDFNMKTNDLGMWAETAALIPYYSAKFFCVLFQMEQCDKCILGETLHFP